MRFECGGCMAATGRRTEDEPKSEAPAAALRSLSKWICWNPWALAFLGRTPLLHLRHRWQPYLQLSWPLFRQPLLPPLPPPWLPSQQPPWLRSRPPPRPASPLSVCSPLLSSPSPPAGPGGRAYAHAGLFLSAGISRHGMAMVLLPS